MPTFVEKDSSSVTEKDHILNHFNQHFVSSGPLFESLSPHFKQPNEQEILSGTTYKLFSFEDHAGP